MLLKKILLAYKIISQELLEAVKGGDPGENFLAEREKLLNKISEGNFKQEDIKRLVNEFNILSLEKEIEEAYIQNKIALKQKIENLSASKEANKSYNSVIKNSLYGRDI